MRPPENYDDNSRYKRNGDYVPSRFDVQFNPVNNVCQTMEKTKLINMPLLSLTEENKRGKPLSLLPWRLICGDGACIFATLAESFQCRRRR